MKKKLLDGLKVGAAGCISATTNVTGTLAKKVYDDFVKKESHRMKSLKL